VTFAGFPSRAQATAIPNVFFSDLLPQFADDAASTAVASMAVALYAFHVLGRTRGFPRFLTRDELASEPALATLLARAHTDADEAIDAGLDRACEVGMLLPLCVEAGGTERTLYFLNTAADRRGMETVRRGEANVVGRPVARAVPAERSSVFALYESLVGTVSPLVADELAEAERLYPAEWLQAAFREAAAQNARNWRYVSRILERWAVEGPDHAKTGRDSADGERYFSGKYGRILKQRLKP
jgi:DnaD/phage-associated family protein